MSDRVTATNPEGDYEIFIMKADGSHQRQITFNALDDESPAWSPDDRRIVFVRDFDPIEGQVDHDLFTMTPTAQSSGTSRARRVSRIRSRTGRRTAGGSPS